MHSTMTLREFFATVYRPLKLRGKAANTLRLYEATFASIHRVTGADATLGDMNDLWVAQYLETLARRTSERTHKPVSPYTVEKQRSQICALWRFACDRNLHPTGIRPSITQETLPERTPEAWTHEEMQRLFAAAAAAPGRIGKYRVGAVMPAIIAFIYDTGERITAVLDTLRDDYHRPHALVRAEARKGRKKDKLFTLSPETCDLIEAISDPLTPELIPIPRSLRSRLWPIFGEIVAAAGLSGGRSAKYHKIRRTVASAYAAAGQDSTALLGHSSKKMTERFYLDPRITGGPPAPCEVLPRLSLPGKPRAG